MERTRDFSPHLGCIRSPGSIKRPIEIPDNHRIEFLIYSLDAVDKILSQLKRAKLFAADPCNQFDRAFETERVWHRFRRPKFFNRYGGNSGSADHPSNKG